MQKLLQRLFDLLVSEVPGVNTTHDWIYKQLTTEERQTFTTEVDKRFITEVIKSPWFVEDLCRKFYNKYEDGNTYLTFINYIKNGFGFSGHGNVFCHATKYHNSLNFEDDCKAFKYFVVKAVKGPKGYQANEITLLDDLLDDHITDKLKDTIANATMETFKDNAVLKLRNEESNKRALQIKAEKKAALQKALNELVGNFKKKIFSESVYYGGHKDYEFSFENSIDEETFIKFLELLGLKTVAKPCLYPISPEKVEYHCYREGHLWTYKWIGEWDD